MPAYFASAFVVFLASSDASYMTMLWGEQQRLIDFMFLFLLVLLGLSIRVTRRELFRLDTQDVLVLLVLISALFLTLGATDSIAMTGIVARVALLLYAAEYAINRTKNTAVLQCFSCLSFLMVGFIYLL